MIERIPFDGKKYINLVTKKESFLIDDIIEDSITINPNFICKAMKQKTIPFKEINIVPPRDLYNFQKMDSIIKPRNLKKELNYQQLLDSLFNFIDENWDTSKTNIFLHSSGLDTRVISKLLRKVYLNKGGTIKFVCLAPEIEFCPPILEYVGWGNNHEILTFDSLNNEQSFDFYTLWKPVNAISSFPQNQLYNVVENLIQDVDNTIIWGASFFNEVFDNTSTIQNFLKRIYYSRSSSNKSVILKPDFMIPLFNMDSMKIIFESKPSREYRLNLLKFLDNELFQIPGITRQNLQDSHKVPDKIFEKLVVEFKKSFFYKDISHNIKFDPSIRKNEEMWTKFVLASFVEHLLKRNIKIKWEK